MNERMKYLVLEINRLTIELSLKYGDETTLEEIPNDDSDKQNLIMLLDEYLILEIKGCM